MARAIAAAMVTLWIAAIPARAIVIELKDVASDRVERQRAEAIGQLPLPGTPNVGQLAERLAEKHMSMGNPILIRVFKASSELELWMKSGDRYELFATYPICNWSGTIGPKLLEGDKQSPEGVYTVASQQLHLVGRHPRSLNLGFPNALDRQMNRTGSYILIHGGCSSVGCFAMTNPVIEEIYSLALAALNQGRQDALQVHVFPFRLTEERLQAYAANEWSDFWRNLKDVNDSFERTHLPPQITICEGRYWVEDSTVAEEAASHGPLAVCAASQAEVASLRNLDDAQPAVSQPWWPQRLMIHPALVPSRPSAPMVHSPRDRFQVMAAQSSPRSIDPQPGRTTWSGLAWPRGIPLATLAMTSMAKTGQFAIVPGVPRPNDLGTQRSLSASLRPLPVACSQTRPSCRHWVAVHVTGTRAAMARAHRLQGVKLGMDKTGRQATRRL